MKFHSTDISEVKRTESHKFSPAGNIGHTERGFIVASFGEVLFRRITVFGYTQLKVDCIIRNLTINNIWSLTEKLAMLNFQQKNGKKVWKMVYYEI